MRHAALILGRPVALGLCAVLLLAGGAGADQQPAEDGKPVIDQLRKVGDFSFLPRMYGDKPCFIFDQNNTSELFKANRCFDLEFPGRPVVFVYGDSHSASLSLGIRSFLKERRINLAQMSFGWCEPTSNVEGNRFCRDIIALALEKIAALKPDVLVWDSHWVVASAPGQYYQGARVDFFPHLMKRIEEVHQAGAKQVVLVGQIPVWYPDLPNLLIQEFAAKDRPVPERTFVGVSPDSLQIEPEMASLQLPPWMSYLSLKSLLCNEEGCLTRTGPNLETDLTVWDYGHLTPNSSRYVADRLVGPKLLELLNAARAPGEAPY
jgi:hypothetical protein